MPTYVCWNCKTRLDPQTGSKVVRFSQTKGSSGHKTIAVYCPKCKKRNIIEVPRQ